MPQGTPTSTPHVIQVVGVPTTHAPPVVLLLRALQRLLYLLPPVFERVQLVLPPEALLLAPAQQQRQPRLNGGGAPENASCDLSLLMC